MPVETAGTVAVIGAGSVGRELARRAALAGFRVVLEDLFPTSLSAAQEELRQALEEAVVAGQIDRTQADEAYQRLECVTTIEDAARRAHVVMETGPDDMESKLEMFCLLDRFVLPGTVIVSNCRHLELSDTAANAASVVGMYFEGDRAEIHCSPYTGPAAVEVARKLASRMAASYTITGEPQTVKA
ncbi:MAG: 3-hydroxyacyl-CoA dehydrogenase NAD-binding domain-containing protein [Acidobacteriota bacterium]|nr:3-hydroxyacyl-CoA dehydrogenase NAD-binding domain-containing protein [Acidobacteriota bacterium]